MSASDSKVDAVGACGGVRGSRIRSIVDELGGEKIDIVRWHESSKNLIANSLKPAEVAEIALCFELSRAIVVVVDDQLSLAIGKRGQNVRLAARLTGWDIDILTPAEFNGSLDALEHALREVEGVDSRIIDQIIAMGMVSVMDVEEVGPKPLVNELEMDEEFAKLIVSRAAEEARRIAAQPAKDAAEKQAAESAPAGDDAATAPAEDGAEDGAADAEVATAAEVTDKAVLADSGDQVEPDQTTEIADAQAPQAADAADADGEQVQPEKTAENN